MKPPEHLGRPPRRRALRARRQLGDEAEAAVLDHLRHPRPAPRRGQRRVEDPRDGAAAQVGLEDLADGGLRQLGQDLEVLRHRRRLGDMVARMRHQLLARSAVAAGDQLDIDRRQLAGTGVRLADRAGEGDRRVLHHRVLDQRRVDVVPAADDQVLGAAGDPDVAVGVDPPEIAGAQIAVRR